MSARADFISLQLKLAKGIVSNFKFRYPAAFLVFMTTVFELEGGFSANNNDGAGETLYGLTAQSHPDLRSRIRAGTLTVHEVLNRYYERYWMPLKGIDDLSKGIAFFIFDSHLQGCTYCVTQGLLGIANLETSERSINARLIAKIKTMPKEFLISSLKDIHSYPVVLASMINDQIAAKQRKNGRQPVNMLKGMTIRVAGRAKKALELEGVYA